MEQPRYSFFFCVFRCHNANLDLISVKFEAIRIDMNAVATAKTPAQLESLALKHYPLKRGEFMFLEWTKFTTEDILVTSDRSALISSQTSEFHASSFQAPSKVNIFFFVSAATQIQRVLSVWIHRSAKLQLVGKTTNTLRHEDNGNLKVQMLKHMDIGAPPSANYDVLVSVFHPRPDQQKVRWDVRAAIDSKNWHTTTTKSDEFHSQFSISVFVSFIAYLRPFVNEIGAVSNFVLKSQWKYQVPFELAKKQVNNGSFPLYFFF